jgi:nicotinamide phosphoribosyltransferase
MNIQDYKRKNHVVPRLLAGDAYTIGSNGIESEKAKEESTYYIAARKFLDSINPVLYRKDDTRYILSGLGRIIDHLLFEPITMDEIHETDRFLEYTKVTTKGLTRFNYPRELWVEIVEKYGGRIPIEIKALPDGSVFYPSEPIVEIKNLIKGYGVLAAWFESKVIQLWSATEMTTQLEHWVMYYKNLMDKVYGALMTDAEKDFKARLMLHNFGDRSGMVPQESDWLGETALLSFSGSDTFSGGYCAWKNSNETKGTVVSILALAHRNVESYETEFDCFHALYEYMQNDELGSFVADCNNFKKAILTVDNNGINPRCLLGLALRSYAEKNGKIVVARPDSGVAVEQVLWLCRLAKEHGLYREIDINGKIYYGATFLRFIEGDGMTWEEMQEINDALLAENFLPWEWGLYGCGGGLRNRLSRDNGSFKYGLCSVGFEKSGRVKFSETPGKSTLPGPFKLLRNEEALKNGRTIVMWDEEGVDAREVYYNGLEKNFFGRPMFDNNLDYKATIQQQLATMPKRLPKDIPASEKVINRRLELLMKHAPEKLEFFK